MSSVNYHRSSTISVDEAAQAVVSILDRHGWVKIDGSKLTSSDVINLINAKFAHISYYSHIIHAAKLRNLPSMDVEFRSEPII